LDNALDHSSQVYLNHPDSGVFPGLQDNESVIVCRIQDVFFRLSAVCFVPSPEN